MVFGIIGIIVLLIGIGDFKRGFLLFLIYKLFLNQNISLIDIPGLPLLTLDMFITIMFFIFFFIKKDILIHQKRICTDSFPLRNAFTLLMFSWVISSVFSIAGFGGCLSSLLKSAIEELLIVIMIWKCVNSDCDYKFLIKGFTYVFFAAALYMLYERLLNSNPLMDYELSLMGNSSKAVDFDYGIDAGRGYRSRSIFFHAIGAGMNFVLFFVMIFVSNFYNFLDVKKIKMAFLTAAMCIPCMLFTGCRGPIVFFVVALLGIVNFRDKKFWGYSLIGLLTLFLASPFISQFEDLLMSLISTTAQEEVGGSNADMRMEQLASAVVLMSINPITGLGFKYESVINSVDIDALLGKESMWFFILPQFGILGAIVNLVLAYYCIWKIPSTYKSKPARYLALSYWITGTMTSVPGFLLYFYYLVYFYFLKVSNKKATT